MEDRRSLKKDRFRHPLTRAVVVLLENGESFEGTAAAFDSPGMPKSKIFFKNKNKELCIPTDINIQNPDKLSSLTPVLNSYLIQLQEEANMEFPAWLEKYSSRAGEANPYFNLDEIREEYNFKRIRFGVWRKSAEFGFFDCKNPQYAKFNKIIHFELRKPDSPV